MKKFAASLLAVLLLAMLFAVPASAAETSTLPDETVSSDELPYYEQVEEYLTTSSWKTIGSWEPWFDVNLVCVNATTNSTAITFRVLDQNYLLAGGGEKACNPNGQVEFSLSGGQTYTIQAKANWSSATCLMTLSDGWG